MNVEFGAIQKLVAISQVGKRAGLFRTKSLNTEKGTVYKLIQPTSALLNEMKTCTLHYLPLKFIKQ